MCDAYGSVVLGTKAPSKSTPSHSYVDLFRSQQNDAPVLHSCIFSLRSVYRFSSLRKGTKLSWVSLLTSAVDANNPEKRRRHAAHLSHCPSPGLEEGEGRRRLPQVRTRERNEALHAREVRDHRRLQQRAPSHQPCRENEGGGEGAYQPLRTL